MQNVDKVTMKHFYHIRCNPCLDEGLCAMRRIPCDCPECVEQLSIPWLPNLYKTLQTCYAIKTVTCDYSSILCGYNKWYICQLTLKKETTNPDEMDIKDELVLNGMTWAAAYNIGYNTIGAFQTRDSITPG